MFGYVRAVEGNFSEEARSRYQAAYCGLCHALGRRCGVLARFTLNYDFALLAMLFAPAEPVWCERRCFAHPVRKRRCCGACAGFDLAADESVILFWQKLADDTADKGFFSGLFHQHSGSLLGFLHSIDFFLRHTDFLLKCIFYGPLEP